MDLCILNRLKWNEMNQIGQNGPKYYENVA